MKKNIVIIMKIIKFSWKNKRGNGVDLKEKNINN